MNRFTQSANNFYSTISNNRPATTNIKGARMRIMSTVESFKPNSNYNSQRPQTGTIMRSSSSSFRNTKGKLERLGDQLSILLDSCKQARTDTKELQLQLDILKEELTLRGIDHLKIDLTQEVKGLQKIVKIQERSNLLRFDALQQTCHALNRNSRQIKGKLNQIHERLFELQNLLGFHGVRDKLKY